MILRVARSRAYEPGTNLRGDQEAGAWLFLLPGLDIHRAAVIGAASRGTRIALGALGAAIVEARSPADALAESPDLVYVAGDAVSDLVRDDSALAALRRLIGEGCNLYVARPRGGSHVMLGLMRALGVSTSILLGRPAPGKSTAGEPSGTTALLMPDAAWKRKPAPARALGRLAKRVRRRRAVLNDELVTVRAVLAGAEAPRSDEGLLISAAPRLAESPPEYVLEAARAAGHDLDGASWTLAPPRGYRSQKVVFHLAERGEIVKITQDARFNASLRAEYDALDALEQWTAQHPGAAPRALFMSEHARLLVVGETRLEGDPFRSRSNGTTSCAVVLATLETLLALGLADPHECSGTDVASALSELVERYVVRYDPSAEQRRLLHDQLRTIAQADGLIPSAFSHGDPMTLNVLVRPDGGVGLVDWENAEPVGLPLWDFQRFVYAYAAWGAERTGRRWTAAGGFAAIYGATPYRELLGAWIGKYRAAAGLPPELVPALLVTCWVADALREATRLPARPGRRGHAAGVLTRLAAADGEALRALGRAEGR